MSTIGIHLPLSAQNGASGWLPDCTVCGMLQMPSLAFFALLSFSLWAADPGASSPHEVLEIRSPNPSLGQIYKAYERAHQDWAYIHDRGAQQAFQRALLALLRENAKQDSREAPALTRKDFERIVKYAPSPAALVPALRAGYADAALERLSEVSGLLRSAEHRKEFVEQLAANGTLLTGDTWREIAGDLQPEVSQRLDFLHSLSDETPHHRVMAMLQFEPTASNAPIRAFRNLYKPFLGQTTPTLTANRNSQNLYERLGVPPWASNAELSEAYQRLRATPGGSTDARTFDAWVVLTGGDRQSYDRIIYRFSPSTPVISPNKIFHDSVQRADSIGLLKAVLDEYHSATTPQPEILDRFRALAKEIRDPKVLQHYIDYHLKTGRPPQAWELDELQPQLHSTEIDAMNKWVEKWSSPNTSDADRLWLRLLSFTNGTGARMERDQIPFSSSETRTRADILTRWATEGGETALAGYHSELQKALERRNTLERQARPPRTVERTLVNWYRAEWTVPSLALLTTPAWVSSYPELAGAAFLVAGGVRYSRSLRDRYSLSQHTNNEALKTENANVGTLKFAVESMKQTLQLPLSAPVAATPSARCLETYSQLGMERH